MPSITPTVCSQYRRAPPTSTPWTTPVWGSCDDRESRSCWSTQADLSRETLLNVVCEPQEFDECVGSLRSLHQLPVSLSRSVTWPLKTDLVPTPIPKSKNK